MTQYPESPPSGGAASVAKETAQTAKDEAASVARTAVDSGKDVAGSAAQSGRRLAHDAKGEAKDVAREAGRQTRDLMGQTREQLTTQAAEQQKRLAGGLRALGGELATMADASTEPGVASDLVGQAAHRADALAEWLDDREPGALLEEVKTFARERPGTFLAIAAVAGLAAGRLTRGIKDESSSTGTTGDETPLYGDGPTGVTGDSPGTGVPATSGVGTVPSPVPAPSVPVSTPDYGTTGYGGPSYGSGTTGPAQASTTGFGTPGYDTPAPAGPTSGATGATGASGASGVSGVGTTPPPAPPARQSIFPPVTPDPLTDPDVTRPEDDIPPTYPPAPGGGLR